MSITRPRDPMRPLVWIDELTKQLIKETREPRPDGAGTPGSRRLRIRRQRHGQYVHEVAPLKGWRHVKVTDRHAAVDYAHALRTCPTFTFQTQGRSSSSETISTRTSRLH